MKETVRDSRQEPVYADACQPGGEPEPISPAEFDAALAEAEYLKAVSWWGDHHARHDCLAIRCPVRLALVRVCMALDDLRNNVT